MSSIGVLYFIFLDIIDVIFCYYQFIVTLLFGKTEREIKMLEETVSNQLRMITMDYEGMVDVLITFLVFFSFFALFCVLVVMI